MTRITSLQTTCPCITNEKQNRYFSPSGQWVLSGIVKGCANGPRTWSIILLKQVQHFFSTKFVLGISDVHTTWIISIRFSDNPLHCLILKSPVKITMNVTTYMEQGAFRETITILGQTVILEMRIITRVWKY